jgi:hypothetical protein
LIRRTLGKTRAIAGFVDLIGYPRKDRHDDKAGKPAQIRQKITGLNGRAGQGRMIRPWQTRLGRLLWLPMPSAPMTEGAGQRHDCAREASDL